VTDDPVRIGPTVDQVWGAFSGTPRYRVASFARVVVVKDALDDRPAFFREGGRLRAADLAMEPTEADVVPASG